LSTIAQKLDAGTFKLDPVHSHVSFAVSYLGGTFRGSFAPVDGALEVSEDGSISLKGSTKAENVKVQEENLTGHLQSPDFFDAERAPELSFESNEVNVDGSSVTVKGDLSIKGASKPVELKGSLGEPLTDPFGNERVGLKLTGSIDRTAFGIEWNNPLPSGEPALGNDVTLESELFFVKS
jgi:polyisoprenoid-binding protein YceI